MIKDNKKQGGFSLVELLIVVAIIILLATISVIALNDQRAKARDARRISDIRQVRTALEFYHSDEDQYPVVDKSVVLGQKGSEKLCAKAVGAIVSLETPCSQDTTYMATIPKDPLADRQYLYQGNVKDYEIIFNTEKPSSLGLAGQYSANAEGINKK
ncbi:MAG: type II secretion system protein [Candidatus Parcubacteria bacterium]|nr:type II secretion system protein [Candidatus Parcubacteria bacterium]